MTIDIESLCDDVKRWSLSSMESGERDEQQIVPIKCLTYYYFAAKMMHISWGSIRSEDEQSTRIELLSAIVSCMGFTNGIDLSKRIVLAIVHALHIDLIQFPPSFSVGMYSSSSISRSYIYIWNTYSAINANYYIDVRQWQRQAASADNDNDLSLYTFLMQLVILLPSTSSWSIFSLCSPHHYFCS